MLFLLWLANLFLRLKKTQFSWNCNSYPIITLFRWENKNTKDNISKEEILGKYFSLLTDQEIMKLYKIYEDDFRNFGYKFNFRSLKLSWCVTFVCKMILCKKTQLILIILWYVLHHSLSFIIHCYLSYCDIEIVNICKTTGVYRVFFIGKSRKHRVKFGNIAPFRPDRGWLHSNRWTYTYFFGKFFVSCLSTFSMHTGPQLNS